MPDAIKRLAPKGDVLRELYLKSGNECAFADCHRVMINHDGVFVGQICHIEAAEAGGERFNKKQTNEERRSFPNLLLMCYEHHTITNDVGLYPVPVLQEMKKVHERKFGDIVQKIRSSISDHTEATEVTYSENLGRLHAVLGWAMDDGENVSEMASFSNAVRKLPIPTRELLVVLVNRASPISGFSCGALGLAVKELQLACDLSFEDLKTHLHILDTYGLIKEGYEEDFNGLEGVLFKKYNGWEIAADIKVFAENTETSLSQILVDLRFDLLDN